MYFVFVFSLLFGGFLSNCIRCSSFIIFLLCGTENNRTQYKVNMLHYTSGRMSSKTQVFYLLSLLQLVSGAKRTYMSTVILSAHEQNVYVTAISLSKFVRMYLQILSWFDNLQDVTYFAMTKTRVHAAAKN